MLHAFSIEASMIPIGGTKKDPISNAIAVNRQIMYITVRFITLLFVFDFAMRHASNSKFFSFWSIYNYFHSDIAVISFCNSLFFLSCFQKRIEVPPPSTPSRVAILVIIIFVVSMFR